METPSRRRRLVIADSPSSQSSFCLEDEEDGDSTFSSDDTSEQSPKHKKTSDTKALEGIVEPMKNISLSSTSASRKEQSTHQVIVIDSDDEAVEIESKRNDPTPKTAVASSKIKRFSRRGLDSLSFDSDSDDSYSDSDSSFEIPPAAFPPRRQTAIEDDDESDISVSGDDDSFQSAREELSCSSEDKDDEGDEEGRWKYNSDRKEVSLSSRSEVKMPKLAIPSKLFKTLFDYQKEGVAWMAGLHNGRIGGLLGDDMGLGKTYQVLAFIGGLMKAQTIRNCLVVAPVSVLRSWEREANKVAKACVPHLRIQVVSSAISKAVRFRRLQEAQECPSYQPSLVITTYGLVRSSTMDFVSDCGKWDYVVLDEAHTIKNPSADLSKCCRRIARHKDTRKLIMTGTPIMNNLKELWALLDFVQSGRVLGPLSRFMNSFANPIEDARSSNATSHEMRIGERANKELQEKIRPYFLQRSKLEYLADKLPKKRDHVVWVGLSDEQRKMYAQYVESKDSAVAQVLSGISTSPLEAVTWLKKLCGHPVLVQYGDSERLVKQTPVNQLKLQSSKLQALSKLVEELCSQGHKTLIFSQSTKMLNIIERVLENIPFARIDGSTKETERQRRVDDFNSSNGKAAVMLLSTKAAGVGLTLTGADRAVIYDPSWNPAEDAQAVDRCYRIGQTKEVAVFRFITAGTVEEKMYEKQVHKDGIRRAVMTSMGSATTRYFDRKELRKLFKLGAVGVCEFLDRLKQRGIAEADDMKASIMITHQAIVEVSSHDKVYLSDTIVTISDDETTESRHNNPFSAAKAPPPSASTTKHYFDTADPSPIVLGRSQRALLKGSNNKKSMDKQTKADGRTSTTEKENERKTINAKLSSKKGEDFKEVSLKAGERPTSSNMIQEADRLCRGGNKVDAMKILMDLLDEKSVEVEKVDKIAIHKRIARVANELEWL
ncbi:unnamed protein product [Cylindrotheca closterium]|uniref:Uncharacterized protein n=1 Tax=Cylindrotheca closterium TaxID=2856 RepID=A0AAD2FY91_9STRA|nr:unnamed protein product [Cylindrotheca closterium]